MSRQTFKTSQGLCLMQDGATSHTAHTPVFEPFVSSQSYCFALAIQIAIKHNWDVIGRVVRRRGLANLGQFTCTAICNGRMGRNYTSHVECLRYVTDIDAHSLPDHHRSE